MYVAFMDHLSLYLTLVLPLPLPLTGLEFEENIYIGHN